MREHCLTFHAAASLPEGSDVGLNTRGTPQLILEEVPRERGGEEGGREREKEGEGREGGHSHTVVVAQTNTYRLLLIPTRARITSFALYASGGYMKVSFPLRTLISSRSLQFSSV